MSCRTARLFVLPELLGSQESPISALLSFSGRLPSDWLDGISIDGDADNLPVFFAEDPMFRNSFTKKNFSIEQALENIDLGSNIELLIFGTSDRSITNSIKLKTNSKLFHTILKGR